MTLEVIIFILLVLFIMFGLTYLGKTLIEIEEKKRESDR